MQNSTTVIGFKTSGIGENSIAIGQNINVIPGDAMKIRREYPNKPNEVEFIADDLVEIDFTPENPPVVKKEATVRKKDLDKKQSKGK